MYTKAFDCDKIGVALTVRNRKPYDTVCINSDGKRKKLKDFFIDEKVPRDERNKVPLIASGNEILWILGYRCTESFETDSKIRNLIYIHVWEDQ